MRGVLLGHLEIRRSPLYFFVGLFLFVSGIATYLSIDVSRSILGGFADPSRSLVSSILCFIFFVIFSSFFKDYQGLRTPFISFTFSLGSIIFFEALRHVSFLLWNIHIPSFFAEPDRSLIILLSLFVLFGAYTQIKHHSFEVCLIALIFVASGILIEAHVKWILFYFLLGIGVYLFVLARYRGVFLKKKLLFFILSILFVGTSFFAITGWDSTSPSGLNYLDPTTSRAVMRGVSQERPWFGFGPDTFLYTSQHFRPPSFNNKLTWNIHFERSSLLWFDIFNDMGWVGLSVFGVLVISYFLFLFFKVRRIILEPFFLVCMPLFIGSVALLCSSFFYNIGGNTILILYFLGILLYGFCSVSKGDDIRVIRLMFRFAPQNELRSSFCVILVFVGVIFLGVLWAREITGSWYVRSISSLPHERAIIALNHAIVLAPWRYEYIQELSSAYLGLAFQETGGRVDIKRFEESASLAVESRRRVADLVPQDSVSWEQLGILYERLGSLIIGPYVFAEGAYNHAITLEPNNPLFYVELGSLYGKEMKNERDFLKKNVFFKKAEEKYTKAIEFKPDYVDASLGLASLEEARGNIRMAISLTEHMFTFYPDDEKIMLELARLYHNSIRSRGGDKKLLGSAELLLLKIISLHPNSPDAYFLLGSLYAEMHQTKKSIFFFEQALLFTPESQREQMRREIKKIHE